DRDPADLDPRFLRKRDQPQTPSQLAIRPQQQMLRPLVEAIEIGIGAMLLDDKDRLAKPQYLVQQPRRQITEAVPFQTCPIAGSHARLDSIYSCRQRPTMILPRGRPGWNRAITARFPMSRSTTGQSLNGPTVPGSPSGSSPT